MLEELLWPQFVKLPAVSKLPLHEQIQQYNQYLADLSITRLTWLEMQTKGPKPKTIQNIGFLAQEEFDPISEDYFLVLQEDGFAINVTALI